MDWRCWRSGLVECGGTTGGNLIQMPLQVGGIARDASQPFTFLTGQGWTVTLTAAQVVLGPLYFNIDAPSTASFRTGVVIVQATDAVHRRHARPDAPERSGWRQRRDGNRRLGRDRILHHGRTATTTWRLVGADGGATTLPAPLAANGQKGTAYLAGEATKQGAVVDFAGRVQITGALVSEINPIDFLATLPGACAGVNPLIPPGCSLKFTTTSGPLQLRVKPSFWFDQANFCDIVRPPPVQVGDAGARDAGPSAVSTVDGGVDAGSGIVDAGSGVVAPCAPTAGTVYDWADTNPFNSAVLQGMKGTDGVYLFSLGGQ